MVHTIYNYMDIKFSKNLYYLNLLVVCHNILYIYSKNLERNDLLSNQMIKQLINQHQLFFS